ncbi:MAG: hypothetical protein FD133_672 [Erysipelotrichaceae bacterium]|nr:MAG: hypothetical protein FD179_429 [Erysipelotrichaceae bacterium]TXT18750.1 MAG: hypothetical protein FD133_672 [Erysipelotrichaceae bacterium]
MLYEIVHRFPQDMIPKENGPFISLYQPTHRSFPDRKQDHIVFKNLIREIENSFKLKLDEALVESIMKPFHELKEDDDFWNATSEGIAVFANQDKCIVYNLNNPVKEFAVVANSYHIKPLLQAFQSIENFQLLGINREKFTLYQGNRFGLNEIKIDSDTLKTLHEVLGDRDTESHLSQRSTSSVNGPTMYHGQSDTNSKIDIDTEKYFRYVDSFVLENYSKISKLPLILVCLTEYRTEFNKLSNNPYLLEEGINKSIESLELDEIHSMAREIMDVINSEKTQKLTDAYGSASAASLGSSDLIEVAKAAFESRVDTLFIEEDKIIPGKLDDKNGKIKFGDTDSTNFDDILDDLAELVLLYGGKVYVLPKDKMPSTTGITAIYRYN